MEPTTHLLGNFMEASPLNPGSNEVFTIRARNGSVALGAVKWYERRREYGLRVTRGTVLSEESLWNITMFLIRCNHAKALERRNDDPRRT